jgi:hypothetical protein
MSYNPSQPRDQKGKWTEGIVDSLERQLRTKGHAPVAAHQLAIEILTNQGTLDSAGNLTAKGRDRERMGRAERAKDRAARQLGRKPTEMAYQKSSGKAHVK